MSNAKFATPVSSKGSKTMSDSIYHVIRATLLSVLVWYTLTHLADLIRFTNDLLAAPPHTKTVLTIVLSLLTFTTCMVFIAVHYLSKVAIEMVKQARSTPNIHDVQN